MLGIYWALCLACYMVYSIPVRILSRKQLKSSLAKLSIKELHWKAIGWYTEMMRRLESQIEFRGNCQSPPQEHV